jgi:uncharacterized protein
MKGSQHPKNDATLNPSGNPSIHDVIAQVDPIRRRFIAGSVGAGALAAAGGLTLSGVAGAVEALSHGDDHDQRDARPGIGFQSIPATLAPVPDRVTVPPGYTAQLFVAWGDPILPGGAPFVPDASQTAFDQLRQFGMHNDGMHFFPFEGRQGVGSSRHGMLCVNNEYTHEELLFADGQVGASGYSIGKTRKSQAAHGVSLLEAKCIRGHWTVLKHSRYARRITANTPMRISGPAAGHALLQANEYTITELASRPTGKRTDGHVANGTVNNCAHGVTPWGTYLTCEENWNGNFGANLNTGGTLPPLSTELGKLNNRYGVTAAGFGYRWHTTDPRWDVAANQNEPHLFGWVVEIDPMRPHRKPVKRTALGRFKHESAQFVVDRQHRVAFYMGDDERNEYIYKFVCARRFQAEHRDENRDMLDNGTLYVARFNPDLTGQWIALLPSTLGLDGVALRDNPNFTGANDDEVLAKILIKSRMAGDAVGATMMDRPEWTGARPRLAGYNEFDDIEIYCTLTNNNRRGSAATPSSNRADGSTVAGSARPAVDAANPREDNIYGHIIRWREAGKSVSATEFEWDIFVQAGDTRTAKLAKPTNDYRGNIVAAANGSADFGAPDGLWFDRFGRLWVQTDQVGDGSGDWANIGSNCMVCADPRTGEMRRFLTTPNRCEVTGVTMTPDAKTMFIGIQHPGEDALAANPTQFSAWPSNQWSVEADGVTALPVGRPRSSVVVITKDDGGVIGT